MNFQQIKAEREENERNETGNDERKSANDGTLNDHIRQSLKKNYVDGKIETKSNSRPMHIKEHPIALDCNGNKVTVRNTTVSESVRFVPLSVE